MLREMRRKYKGDFIRQFLFLLIFLFSNKTKCTVVFVVGMCRCYVSMGMRLKRWCILVRVNTWWILWDRGSLGTRFPRWGVKFTGETNSSESLPNSISQITKMISFCGKTIFYLSPISFWMHLSLHNTIEAICTLQHTHWRRIQFYTKN